MPCGALVRMHEMIADYRKASLVFLEHTLKGAIKCGPSLYLDGWTNAADVTRATQYARKRQ